MNRWQEQAVRKILKVAFLYYGMTNGGSILYSSIAKNSEKVSRNPCFYEEKGIFKQARRQRWSGRDLTVADGENI